MRNNRNTVGEWKPPQRNITNSVERKTLTNPQSYQQTQLRALTQQQMNDRISKTINQALMKLPSQGKRTSISTAIQPKASNLLSNIGSFMTLIDRSFEKTTLQIDNIPQLLTFWGYPNSYNKSVFQPVGAPHTWPVCMQMMEFLAEIGLFIFEYRSIGQEYRPDAEEIDLILDAFARDDLSEFETYINKIRSSLVKEQEDLNYKIQSSELTLKNIKNSQRSLSEVESEEQVLRQKFERQSQNVIEIDQQNNAILSEIQATDDKIEELLCVKENLMKKITSLEQQISNQELSLEEATRIQAEMKQYNSRIKDAQNEAESKKKQYEVEKNKMVQIFYKIVDDLNEIKTSMKKYQIEMEKRNIQIPFPQTDHVAFTQALHSQDMQVFNQAVTKMIETEKIRNMLIGQESLADILDHEIRNMNNQVTEQQLKKKHIQHDNKQGSGELGKLQKYWDEALKELQDLNTRRNQTLEHTQFLKERINIGKLQNQDLLRKEIDLTQQTKQRKQYMVQGIKMLNRYEADCQKVIRAMEEKEQETQRKIEEILNRIQNGFSYLNSELQTLL